MENFNQFMGCYPDSMNVGGGGVRTKLHGLTEGDKDLLISSSVSDATEINSFKMVSPLTNIQPMLSKKIPLTVVCLDPSTIPTNGLDSATRSSIICDALMHFYGYTQIPTRITSQPLIQSYLQILCSYMNSGSISSTGLAKAALDEGYELRLQLITSTEARRLGHTAFNLIKEYIDPGNRGFNMCLDTIQICGFVMMLTLHKSLNESNLKDWFSKRCYAFCGTMGIPQCGQTLIPANLVAFVDTHSFFSCKLILRRCVFNIIRTMSTMEETLYARVFSLIVRQMEWADMSHIHLILYHLLPAIMK